MNVFLAIALTILSCIVIQFIYKIVFGSKKDESQKHETENDIADPVAPAENASNETRPSGKNKKRAAWKPKTDFSHPWLMKNLKGHPGNVLMVDFSANGKFMAATCDGKHPPEVAGHKSLTKTPNNGLRCCDIAITLSLPRCGLRPMSAIIEATNCAQLKHDNIIT
ncbi:unnamed protein product [Colias eurytheme]|nr:unnamed protein product [Colias eurytheme]